MNLVGRKIADASWAVYASPAYVKRYGRPRDVEDLNRHLVIGCYGSITDYPGARWLRSAAPMLLSLHEANIARE